jgi:hypothetical protein
MKRLALRGIRAATVSAIAILSQVGGATAQTYDMPQFITPYDETGVGLYMVFVNGIEDIGGMATFRKAGDVNLGFRGSVNDIGGGDIAFNGGLDVYKQFVEVSESFPLDVAWVTGFGFGWVTGTGEGGFGILRIPGGVSLARQFASEDGKWVLTPYASPRLALDIGLSGPDTKLHFDVDFGLEMQFSQSWLLRFGVTVGHDEALGFGIVF